MTASQSHVSCSRPLSRRHPWIPTKTPLGYPAVSPSRGDPVAIIKQNPVPSCTPEGQRWGRCKERREERRVRQRSWEEREPERKEGGAEDGAGTDRERRV